MAITNTAYKQELRELKEQRTELDRKIHHIEGILGAPKSGSNGTPSARGGVDIRPTVRELFGANNNEAMWVKEIVETVATKLGVEKEIVRRKMVHVIRTELENAGYGKYRLLKKAV